MADFLDSLGGVFTTLGNSAAQVASARYQAQVAAQAAQAQQAAQLAALERERSARQLTFDYGSSTIRTLALAGVAAVALFVVLKRR